MSAVLLVALLSWLAGTVSLLRLQHHDGGTDRFWMMPDSNVYFANADVMAAGEPLPPMFRDRMLLPFLLHLTRSTADHPYPYLYFQQTLHFFYPLLLAGIAGLLFSSWKPALAAAFLYVAYSPARVESCIIATDFLHAFCTISAIYWTLKYLRTDGWLSVFASGISWVLTMLSRPTFMLEWILIAPVLLWNCWQERAGVCKALCLLSMLAVVPLSLTISNFSRFGVATPSFAAFENFHSSLVPSVQTLLRKEAGDPDRTSVVFADQVRRQKAMMDGAWGTLKLWKANKPDGKQAFSSTYFALQTTNKSYISSNLWPTIRLVKGELGTLVFDSNTQWCLGNRGRSIFVWCALTGLLALWWGHRRYRETLWLFLNFGVLLIPASCAIQLWWGRRVGLPADLLFITLAGGILISWKRILCCGLLCCIFKTLNVLHYEPALNCAIICVFAFVVLTFHKAIKQHFH